MKPVPYPVFDAALRVAGEALYWKGSLRQILRTAGVSETTCDRHADMSKYQIFRAVWQDLDRVGTKGRIVQHNLVKELANLDRPESKVPDMAAGQRALEDLRRLAKEQGFLVSPEELARQERQRAAAAKAEALSARRQSLDEIRVKFQELHREANRQRRGYELEALLRRLFRWSELDYQGSYKTEIDQIDGAVVFESFTYLIEARWRQAVATEADLGGFANKVERRIDATRGLFISMAGFRPEVVDLYRHAKDNRLVLMDGQDLAWTLEGRLEFVDLLRAKVQAASVHGDPYVRAAEL